MILFRPVGLEELRLVYEARMRAFPPRLPDQPIFYPVTNAGYATQIARDWNTKSGTRAVFVNFSFWELEDFAADGIERVTRDDLLGSLRETWAEGDHRHIPLGVTA